MDDLAIGGVFEIGGQVAGLEVEEPAVAFGFEPAASILHDDFAGVGDFGAGAKEHGFVAAVGEVLVLEEFGAVESDGGSGDGIAGCIGRSVFAGFGIVDLVRGDVMVGIEVDQGVGEVDHQGPGIDGRVFRFDVDANKVEPFGTPEFSRGDAVVEDDEASAGFRIGDEGFQDVGFDGFVDEHEAGFEGGKVGELVGFFKCLDFMALFGQIGDEGFHLGPFVGDEEELHGGAPVRVGLKAYGFVIIGLNVGS